MKDPCFGNYFLIAILIVFFMLLYVYFTPPQPIIIEQSRSPFETFTDKDKKNNTLISMDKIAIIQGNGIPNNPSPSINFDQNDPSTSSVDGTDNTAQSMFVFAYNKCSPDCCGESGGYSCNGGCVCLTNDQKKFFRERGWNNKFNKCSVDEIGS
jgi:hypothetical protein